MMKNLSLVLIILTLLTAGPLALRAGTLEASGETCQIDSDVAATLRRCIPGIEVEAVNPPFSDPQRKYFRLGFWQPVEHNNPKSGGFRQQLVLAHRSYHEPMVLQTSGYNLSGIALSKLSKTFGTNQIAVEHRYFSTSTPTPTDWKHLNIRESAADFHAITLAFKQLYAKAWVNTGASKGGMTSLYHRYFYPSDLTGTVANVAPLSLSNADPRYIEFIDEVGGKKYSACRNKLEGLQRHLLGNRERFQAQISGSFEMLGGKDVAFEHGVQEMTFFYWQYHNPEDPSVGCNQVPDSQSTDSQVLSFFNTVTPLEENYGDAATVAMAAYFYQAATELGSPALKRSHFLDLVKYPYSIDQYVPKGLKYEYSNTSMKEVAEWAGFRGERLMLIYGEYDPWTAGQFPTPCTSDCQWSYVPAGNHGANLFILPAAEKKVSLDRLGGWFGKAPAEETSDALLSLGESSEDREFRLGSRGRLR